MSRFNHKISPGRKAKRDVKKDGPLQVLLSKTPAEGAQWVEDNVNSLAEAKTALKFLVKAVIALAHQE